MQQTSAAKSAGRPLAPASTHSLTVAAIRTPMTRKVPYVLDPQVPSQGVQGEAEHH